MLQYCTLFALSRSVFRTSLHLICQSLRARRTGVDWRVVPFTKENGFHPPNSDYFTRDGLNARTRVFPIISNPGNPTGHTRAGEELRELMEMAEQSKNGILLDEAYEMFHDSGGVSGLKYVKDLDNSNVFIAGACTKGLQCPGIRVGWMIASKKNVETLANFSSFGMGGVSHPSQLYAVKLLEPGRVRKAREAVRKHYAWQRQRYGEAFEKMGLKLYTGDGGFYHWLEIPEEWNLTSAQLNERLFKRGAAILLGKELVFIDYIYIYIYLHTYLHITHSLTRSFVSCTRQPQLRYGPPALEGGGVQDALRAFLQVFVRAAPSGDL